MGFKFITRDSSPEISGENPDDVLKRIASEQLSGRAGLLNRVMDANEKGSRINFSAIPDLNKPEVKEELARAEKERVKLPGDEERLAALQNRAKEYLGLESLAV